MPDDVLETWEKSSTNKKPEIPMHIHASLPQQVINEPCIHLEHRERERGVISYLAHNKWEKIMQLRSTFVTHVGKTILKQHPARRSWISPHACVSSCVFCVKTIKNLRVCNFEYPATGASVKLMRVAPRRLRNEIDREPSESHMLIIKIWCIERGGK